MNNALSVADFANDAPYEPIGIPESVNSQVRRFCKPCILLD